MVCCSFACQHWTTGFASVDFLSISFVCLRPWRRSFVIFSLVATAISSTDLSVEFRCRHTWGKNGNGWVVRHLRGALTERIGSSQGRSISVFWPRLLCRRRAPFFFVICLVFFFADSNGAVTTRVIVGASFKMTLHQSASVRRVFRLRRAPCFLWLEPTNERLSFARFQPANQSPADASYRCDAPSLSQPTDF